MDGELPRRVGFATVKQELAYRQQFESRKEAQQDIFDRIGDR